MINVGVKRGIVMLNRGVAAYAKGSVASVANINGQLGIRLLLSLSTTTTGDSPGSFEHLWYIEEEEGERPLPLSAIVL